MALDGAVVFASVFAAPATAALRRGGLQPRQQLGDRLAAGLWFVGLRQRIGAAMASGGRRGGDITGPLSGDGGGDGGGGGGGGGDIAGAGAADPPMPESEYSAE